MATVTGYTAEHADEMQAACLASAQVSGDNLILTRYNDSIINAGSVRGFKGDKGNQGAQGIVGAGSTNDAQIAALLNTSASASQSAVDARVANTRLITDWNTVTTPGRYYNTSKTNAPDANNYEGYVTADVSGNIVQNLWTAGVNTIGLLKQWTRTSIGPTWGPWIQIFGDTGWLTSGVVIDYGGGHILTQACRVLNSVAYVMATLTLPAIGNGPTGNLGNTAVAVINDPRFSPASNNMDPSGFSGLSGRPGLYALSLGGGISIAAAATTSTFAAGEFSSFQFIYVVN